MKSIILKKLILITMSMAFTYPAFADNLGRIFTTPKERQKLERIRQKKIEPKKVEVVEVEKTEPEFILEKETIIRKSITLKGLVHRSDGKNTAWVNESNTLEGDLDSSYIEVPDNKIQSDQVTIIMVDDSSEVDLRVGDMHTPEPIEKETVITVKPTGN